MGKWMVWFGWWIKRFPTTKVELWSFPEQHQRCWNKGSVSIGTRWWMYFRRLEGEGMLFPWGFVRHMNVSYILQSVRENDWTSTMEFWRMLPSGKRLHNCGNHGNSPFFMGQLTISMVMFNSYMKFPEGMYCDLRGFIGMPHESMVGILLGFDRALPDIPW